MPTFTQLPYASNGGQLSTVSRGMTWLPISANKIALLYLASVGGSWRVMMQMVTFNGAQAPVYGPVCMVGTFTGASTNISCSHLAGAKLADGRIVITWGSQFSTTARTSTIGVHLVEYDAEDRFSYVVQISSLAVSETYAAATMLQSHGGQVALAIRNATGKLALYRVSQNVALDLLIEFGYVLSSNAAVRTVFRTAVDGALWIATGGSGSFFAKVSPTYTITHWPTVAGYNSAAKSRGLLPLQNNKHIALSSDIISKFEVYDGASQLRAATDWRGSLSGQFMDAIWLDDRHFLALMIGSTGAAPYTDTVGTADNGNAYIYVGRFHETDNSIEQAIKFPHTLGVWRSNYWQPRCLHKIDENNVAIISATGANNTSTITHALNVSVLSV